MPKFVYRSCIWLLWAVFYAQAHAGQECDWDKEISLHRFYPEGAIADLEQRRSVLSSQERCLVPLLVELSDVYRITGNLTKAEGIAVEALAAARGQVSESPFSVALALHTHANALLANDRYNSALSAYADSLQALESAPHPVLSAKNRLNLAQLEISRLRYCSKYRDKTQCIHTDTFAARALSALQDGLNTFSALQGRHQADALAHLAALAVQLDEQIPEDERRAPVLRDIMQAINRFEWKAYPRQASYAYAAAGRLYRNAQRYAGALSVTRQALFYAHSIPNPDKLLYTGYYQSGDFYHEAGKADEAIEAYQHAARYLKKIRARLNALTYQVNKPFVESRTGQRKLYSNLFELLLEKAKISGANTAQGQADLRRLVEEIEAYRTLELKEYFADECLGTHNKNKRQCVYEHSFSLPEKAAVLYPLVLPEQIELIVCVDGKFHLVTVDAGKKEVSRPIRNLRSGLKQTDSNIEPDAQKLYRRLIQPWQKYLGTVDVIVVVPDDLLRGIPFSVLHDGSRYLLETHAVVTVPALSISFFGERNRKRDGILLSGLSRSLANADPLPYVPDELRAISATFEDPGTLYTLREQDFTKDKFIGKLKERPFSTIHIATHGKFERKAENSYLLTYDRDKRLYLQDLEHLGEFGSFRDAPVELLVLSACEGAVGNSQAALGLSGVAIRAGVESAVASLWQIADKSTCYLMAYFYDYLKHSDISLATALQQAQLDLLHGTGRKTLCGEAPGDEFKHPSHWGAFILIGNWR